MVTRVGQMDVDIGYNPSYTDLKLPDETPIMGALPPGSVFLIQEEIILFPQNLSIYTRSRLKFYVIIHYL